MRSSDVLSILLIFVASPACLAVSINVDRVKTLHRRDPFLDSVGKALKDATSHTEAFFTGKEADSYKTIIPGGITGIEFCPKGSEKTEKASERGCAKPKKDPKDKKEKLVSLYGHTDLPDGDCITRETSEGASINIRGRQCCIISLEPDCASPVRAIASDKDANTDDVEVIGLQSELVNRIKSFQCWKGGLVSRCEEWFKGATTEVLEKFGGKTPKGTPPPQPEKPKA